MAHSSVMSGSRSPFATPAVRRIDLADLRAALAAGLDDFAAMPSHVIFLALIYPIVGLVLAAFTFHAAIFPLLYPLASGFALLGPVAALGLYELSRRREQGLPVGWTYAFDVLRSPAIGAIATLGAALLALFVGWLVAAQALYAWFYGDAAPLSLTAFLSDVVSTGRGWRLIIAGNLVGLVFAACALAISVVSFPVLLDRNVAVGPAVATSLRAVRMNPVPFAAWGAIVAALLLLGSIPLFVGLAVVLPILGHATWHLYRRVVI